MRSHDHNTTTQRRKGMYRIETRQRVRGVAEDQWHERWQPGLRCKFHDVTIEAGGFI